MDKLNAADYKHIHFTATVTGTNQGNTVPNNMIRQFGFIKYSCMGGTSGLITLSESNAAGTSARVMDKTYLAPGETVMVEPKNMPAMVMVSGNSYLRSVVSGSASGEIAVTAVYVDTY